MSQRTYLMAGVLVLALVAMARELRAQAGDVPLNEGGAPYADQQELLADEVQSSTQRPTTLLEYYSGEADDGVDCSESCEIDGSPTRFWASAEYSLWGSEGM